MGQKSALIILEEAVDPSACLKVTMHGIPVADSWTENIAKPRSTPWDSWIPLSHITVFTLLVWNSTMSWRGGQKAKKSENDHHVDLGRRGRSQSDRYSWREQCALSQWRVTSAICFPGEDSESLEKLSDMPMSPQIRSGRAKIETQHSWVRSSHISLPELSSACWRVKILQRGRRFTDRQESGTGRLTITPADSTPVEGIF